MATIPMLTAIQTRLVIGCQCASPVEPPLCDYCHNLPDDAQALFDRVAALTAALEKYGQHAKDCVVFTDHCRCGLTDALDVASK
jgi:hypothetical protein